MKVLMTADTAGGVWTYALELARSLAGYDVEVLLATMGQPLSTEQRAESEKIVNLRIFQSSYKLEWMQNPWNDVDEAGRWLLQIEESNQPDIVHLNDYSNAALPWRSPVIVVGHSCVFSWWNAVKGEDAPEDWNEYKKRVSRGLHSADLVLSPTKTMLNSLIEHYGPLENTDVVSNGRSPLMFRPVMKEPFILSAGRLWDEAKNVKSLERIALELNWPVYIAGEDTHPDGQQTSYSNVNSLGKLSSADLAEWLSRASIYALPVKYEPFGLSVLEAGLSGCVLVLGDIPSLRENWEDAALFVPPDDSESLRATLNDLIADPSYRMSFAERARRRAMGFTCDRMGQHYLAVYQYVVRNHRSTKISPAVGI